LSWLAHTSLTKIRYFSEKTLLILSIFSLCYIYIRQDVRYTCNLTSRSKRKSGCQGNNPSHEDMNSRRCRIVRLVPQPTASRLLTDFCPISVIPGALAIRHSSSSRKSGARFCAPRRTVASPSRRRRGATWGRPVLLLLFGWTFFFLD
jgi:hypothetical protein